MRCDAIRCDELCCVVLCVVCVECVECVECGAVVV